MADSYTMQLGTDTTRTLKDFGGIITSATASPAFYNSNSALQYAQDNTDFLNGGFQSIFNAIDSTSGSTKAHSFEYYTTYYIQVAQSGTYHFNVDVNGDGYSLPTNDQVSFSLWITQIDGQLALFTGSASQGNLSNIYTANLCPGTYQVTVRLSDAFSIVGSQLYSHDYILKVTNDATHVIYQDLDKQDGCIYTTPIAGKDSMLNPIFTVPANNQMVFSAWVREANVDTTYKQNSVTIQFDNGTASNTSLTPSGPVVDGWQRYEGYFTAPSAATTMTLNLVNSSSSMIYFDDIRMHPYNANMKSYVYDPVSLRLVAELDPNNYASFYEYDEEGTLIRTKAETRDGIKTITETRSAKQKNISSLQ